MRNDEWDHIATTLRGQWEQEEEGRTGEPDPALLVRDASGYLPDDPRPIRSRGEKVIAYRTDLRISCVNGEYWEVHYACTEWSGNYRQTGRGRTLPEAFASSVPVCTVKADRRRRDKR